MAYMEAEGLTRYFLRRKKVREAGPRRWFARERETVKALDHVSFQVEAGELVGLIGPNGAGKSTTVKLLTGILTPTEGTCRVAGRVPWQERKQHVRELGVVFGQRTQLWWDVPIADSFDLLREIYDRPRNDWAERLKQISAALELEPLLRTPLRQLSLGQRMRAEVCGSLLHRPRLLFLDEPTIGLDAVSKLALRSFLKEENRREGTTILLTTHDMEDMLALCSRVMVLGHGKLLYDGALQELRRRYDTVHTLRCAFAGEVTPPPLPAGCVLRRDGDAIEVDYPPARVPTGDMLDWVRRAGTLREMTLKEQNVDQLIARMYQELAL